MHGGIVSLVVSTCLVVAATAVAARAQSAPESKPEPKGPAANFKQPMVFYVAKGAPGACGPGCSEWIAAEGAIDPNAEPKLWELLHKIGNDRKPPVFFHSPGGSVLAGIQVGRLLRARGLTAGVGWTVPAGCDRHDPADAACDALKHSGRELPAELDTLAGVCASSCVYTVMGGAVRDLGAGVQLGVHDMFPSATIRTYDESGHIVDRPLQMSAEKARNALQAGQQAITTYLKMMGISPDLLAAGHGFGPDKLHFLTRQEIVALGIDRRDRVESTWSLTDKAPGETSPGVSAVKVIEERDGSAFRKTVLSLTCRGATTVRLQVMHGAGADDEAVPGLRVIAGDRSFPLMPIGSAAKGNDGARYVRDGAELPLAVLDAAAFVFEANATIGQGPDGPAATSARMEVRAAAPALAALAKRCASGTP